MTTRVPIVSPDGLARHTAAFRAFNDERYMRSGSGGSPSYDDLSNLPSIEGVTVRGAKAASDYGLALSSDIPDMEGYATADEVGDAIADAVTGVETLLGGYATKDDLGEFATKGDISGLASRSELSDYATTDDLNATRSTFESRLGSYATNASLDAVRADVTAVDAKVADCAKSSDLEGLATEAYVDKSVGIVDAKLEGCAKASDLDGLASESYVDASIRNVDDKLSGYATKEDVSGFQTASQVYEAIDSKTASLATTASVTDLRKESQSADDELRTAIAKKQDALTLPLPISQGGTGRSNPSDAWEALGGGDIGRLNKGTSASTFLRADGTWAEVPSTDPYAVGQEIVSSVTLNPSALYGGTWETDSSHLFRGVYVYRRIS